MTISADTWALVAVSLFNTFLLVMVSWLSIRRDDAKKEGVLFKIWLMRQRGEHFGITVVVTFGFSILAILAVFVGCVGLFGIDIARIVAGALAAMWGLLLIVILTLALISAIKYETLNWERK